MATGVKLGRDAVLYYNTASFGSPTWTAIPQVSDLSVTAEWDEAEASTRESKMKLKVKTLLGAEVAAKLKVVPSDTALGVIVAALFSDAVVDILVLNGTNATNGCYGFRFECQVHSANEDQGLGNAIFDEVKFKPCPTVNAKQSVLVTTGAPVFTTI